MGLKAGIQFVSAYLQQKLMDPSSQPWQLTQAIAQKYIQHKQRGTAVLLSTPRCRYHLFSFYSLLLGLRGANKRRGVQFSNSNDRSSFGAWVETSTQRSPRDGRKGWGAPFSSVGSTPAFAPGKFARIGLGCWYIRLRRWQIRNGMEVEPALPLIFTR